MGVSREAKAHFDRALRAELRAQRKALVEFIHQLKANRRAAMNKARHVCSTSQTRAKARAAAIRARASEEAKAVVTAAKTACERGKAKARKVGAKELEAATQKRRQAIADERTVLRSSRKKEPRITRRKSERLDEARADLSPDLLPVFEAVKGTLKPSPRKSLTETFLQWVEENPDEANALRAEFAASDDSLIREAMNEAKTVQKALRSRKQLRPDDWKILGTSPEELEHVGLNPNDPDDVIAFLAGYTQHWKDATRAAVPF